MKDSLQVGLEGRHAFTVTEDMSPHHLPAKVLSTPAMVGLLENACLSTVQPHLEEGQTTVGTHVNVSHEGPAFPGEQIQIDVRLQEIRKRRLEFAVEVRSPRGVISSGTHQRAVVDLARFR